MKTIKLALIGYGNVGKAFARMLSKRKLFIEDTYGCVVKISAICTKSRGALMDPPGIDTEAIDMAAFSSAHTAFDVIDRAEYDVLAELTPLDIFTGQPAIDHIKQALARGKHVVTANKGPVAWAYRELKSLAAANNALFYHEAAVMDGVPVFNLARETLKGCRILEIKGILNATTNYVLNEMERGVSRADAIKKGQLRGFVEADPSMDIDGWDAAAKLTALMNVLMDVKITPDEIVREGIGWITKEQLDEAKERRQKVKLLCHGYIENGRPTGLVRPQAVPYDSLFATVGGAASVVTITTDLLGDISVVEHAYQPEIDQTAYGILSDLFRVLDITTSSS